MTEEQIKEAEKILDNIRNISIHEDAVILEVAIRYKLKGNQGAEITFGTSTEAKELFDFCDKFRVEQLELLKAKFKVL